MSNDREGERVSVFEGAGDWSASSTGNTRKNKEDAGEGESEGDEGTSDEAWRSIIDSVGSDGLTPAKRGPVTKLPPRKAESTKRSGAPMSRQGGDRAGGGLAAAIAAAEAMSAIVDADTRVRDDASDDFDDGGGDDAGGDHAGGDAGGDDDGGGNDARAGGDDDTTDELGAANVRETHDETGVIGDVPEVSRKVKSRPRHRRRDRPRSKTIALKRLTRDELRRGALANPPVEGVARPQTRAECRDAPRPCPWVACKHHLYLDINPRTGSIKLNFPDLEPWELQHTCALDVADSGGLTLEEIGVITNLTRERVRQVEVRGLLTLKARSSTLR